MLMDALVEGTFSWHGNEKKTRNASTLLSPKDTIYRFHIDL